MTFFNYTNIFVFIILTELGTFGSEFSYYVKYYSIFSSVYFHPLIRWSTQVSK